VQTATRAAEVPSITTAAMTVPSLAQTLWIANGDLAQACLDNPFVQRLADGTLPVDAFRAYVAQDAYFLEAFARAYALALARSPDRHGLDAFHALIGGVLDELRLHAAYAARWQVDLSGVTPVAATLAYTDFLLATATLRGVGETCAAMTPCMRLYAYLGQQLAASGVVTAENAYAEWVATYASSDFEALASTLESLLDRYASNSEGVRTAYRRAMELELAFFQANV
jgi:thiaminase/transcriptional activator TenA